MRWEEFVTAYPREGREIHHFPPWIAEAMATARHYSHRWGRVLWDLLSGDPPLPADLLQLNAEYTYWYRREMPSISAQLGRRLQSMVAAADAAEDDTLLDLASLTDVLMELNFHRLNYNAQQFWAVLIDPERTAPQMAVLRERARVGLAADAMGVAESRRQFENTEDLFEPFAAPVRQWLDGAITEFDALQVLWEMNRRDPYLVTVPAPAQFEHLARRANVDLVVIDRRARTVCGVQVKSSGSVRTAAKYDLSRMILVDGVHDLANTRAVRTSRRSSDIHVVPWAGFISAHYLLGLRSSKFTALLFPRQDLAMFKLQARRMVGKTRSRNAEAYSRVSERVLAALSGESTAPAGRK